MKVISGKYKGRVLEGYTMDGTRPTMERVKESVFAILQNKMPNSIVLDLFTGSGNLGIESLSQGAKEAYLVDLSSTAISTVEKNLKKIGIREAHVLKMDYLDALRYFEKEKIQFDLIFLDPPYQSDYIVNSLEKIEEYNLVKDNGMVICETDQSLSYDKFSSLVVVKEKKYGGKIVVFLEKV